MKSRRIPSASGFLLTAMAFVAVRMPQAYAQDAVAHHDAAAEGGPKLPQLDTTTFSSQVFWLLVTGVVMYIIMSKLALPKVQGIMRARDDFVHENLRKAAQLRRKAEDTKIDYDRLLQKAEQDSKQVLADTVAAMRQKHDAALQASIQAIQTRTTEAEQRLEADKQIMMKTVDAKAATLADEIMLNVFATKPTAL